MVAPYSHTYSWKPGKNLIWVVALLLILLTGFYGWWSGSNDKQLVDDLNFLNVNGLPLAFVPNVGQSDPAVKFQAQSGASSLFLTQDGLTMVWPVAETEGEEGESVAGSAAALSMHFLDVNPDLDVVTSHTLPGTVNYLRGNDAAAWHTNVATYGAVTYEQLYPGVDLHYGGQANQLTYTFEVAPGVDPEVIRWSYDDNISVSVDETTGALLVAVKSTKDENPLTLVQPLPTAWQMVDGTYQSIPVSYSLTDDRQIHLQVSGRAKANAITIEQSFVTPSNLVSFETGGAITVDDAGAIYVVGETGSGDFPIVNPLQATIAIPGDFDIFVTKFSADGSTIVFSTFLGGSSGDFGYDVAVDTGGNIYVTGRTMSPDFPVWNPYQTNLSSLMFDAFVVKMAPNGAGFVYSTYLGGVAYDTGNSIAVDNLGQAFVTGLTNSVDFPLVNPLDSTHTGGDGFVTKFNPVGSALIFSTYLGGSSYDFGTGIATDVTGAAIVTGHTSSLNFPVVNPLQATYGGDSDAFITRIAPDGSSLLYSTYFGGYHQEGGEDVAVDDAGNIYIVGSTDNNINFPLVNPVQSTYGGGFWDAFLAKISANGSTLLVSTYLGGDQEDVGLGIAVDGNGQIAIVGNTVSANFPTANPIQATLAGGEDLFVAKVASTGNTLIYSTYLGGSLEDQGAEIAADQTGSAYIVGTTHSPDFPTVNPFQSQLAGTTDVMISEIAVDGSALTYSTYLGGGSAYPPTDVTLTGVEGSNPFSNIWLWVAMGVILVVGAWVTRPRTRKPRSVE